MSLLLKDASVILTQDDKRRVLRDCSVFIEGNRIVEIGKGLKGADTVIDCKGKIVMPGLVNSHAHPLMSYGRGQYENMGLWEFLRETNAFLKGKLDDKKFTTICSAVSALEALRSGTTFLQNADRKSDAGLRVSYSYYYTPITKKKEWMKGVKKLFPEKRKEVQGRGQLDVYVHSLYSVPERDLKEAVELVKATGCRLFTHLCENPKEVKICKNRYGLLPAEHLKKIGFLGKTTVVAHGIFLKEKELTLLKQTGTSIVHCPVSNMKLGNGILRLKHVLNKGINVCLGTDSVSTNNCMDMFREMKTASLLQKAIMQDPKAIPPQTALDMATVNGAKAMGVNAGSIEKGKLADVLVLDPEINLLPRKYALHNVVFAATGCNVLHSIIDGEIVIFDRRLAGEIQLYHEHQMDKTPWKRIDEEELMGMFEDLVEDAR